MIIMIIKVMIIMIIKSKIEYNIFYYFPDNNECEMMIERQ